MTLLAICQLLTRKRMLRVADALGIDVDRFAGRDDLAAELAAAAELGGLTRQLNKRERLAAAKLERRAALSWRRRATTQRSPRARDRRLDSFDPPPAGGKPGPRADCPLLPCARVSCQYNLGPAHDTRAGTKGYSGQHSCALAAAAAGGMTLEQVGAELGITRQRTEQLQVRALASLAHTLAGEGLTLVDLLPPQRRERVA